ncbi:MAG: hypothetical protein A2Y50_03200 [Pseudomonadales bacterium RIFCSPLOWO2_12_59_9]|nr:MAG: hypothetical protein A2Y50_03200 [Pseudomonadales bacterium RIFCSPLOWO2_12_59_9]
MDIASWSAKERLMSGFCLLCSLALLVSMYFERAEIILSDLFQTLGFFALITGGTLNPKMFLQPIKIIPEASIQAPSLTICFVIFCVFQLLATLTKVVMQ